MEIIEGSFLIPYIKVVRQMKIYEQVKKHSIKYHKPAPDFFEGALLGNGGLGAVVTTRPDAVVIHFGHNNVWDIRIAEDNQEKIGTFEEIFEKLKTISATTDLTSFHDDPWYREYCDMTQENYRKPYPRPMPCGSVLLGFDRRKVEVLGHELHIENGLCEVFFLYEGTRVTLQLFIDLDQDQLWMRLVDEYHTLTNGALFERVKLIPDPQTPKEFPTHQSTIDIDNQQLSFFQTLPYQEVKNREQNGHPNDKAFRLVCNLSETSINNLTNNPLEVKLLPANEFIACIQLEEGLHRSVSLSKKLPIPTNHVFENTMHLNDEKWRAYWERSGVELEDEFLERIWYTNLYFYNCSIKPGVTCPGLFANWSYGSIGSNWHGDYHMNYNTQQPFWLAFSSNHIDKHLAYVDMVDHVHSISKKWAEEYYQLRGAYFPHSAYPVEMNMMPFPVPHWGWEICETPWTVQSLWWHYLYTMDKDFLQKRAFPLMKDAVLFMVDYMKRVEAHGEGWGDDKYHIFPTVVPELYELTPGFKMNYDCLVDLTLTKFLFHAYIKACTVLENHKDEKELLDDVNDILAHFPNYPTTESQRGTVFVSVPDEDSEVIYNVPDGITTIFPGEDHGLHSSKAEYEIAVNSYENHRNEGGNELVFYNLAGARLGKLDLERFKRQIEYCMLPNGTCTDRVLQAGGRYKDTLSFDFMSRMGIWFENFSLPVVVNECLLQSYNGMIRLFPNWQKEKRAEFQTLRAVGGFLVSALYEDGEVKWVEIISEAGSRLQLYNPWDNEAICIRSFGEKVIGGTVISIETSINESVRFVKKECQ